MKIEDLPKPPEHMDSIEALQKKVDRQVQTVKEERSHLEALEDRLEEATDWLDAMDADTKQQIQRIRLKSQRRISGPAEAALERLEAGCPTKQDIITCKSLAVEFS